jgi:Subtilase family
MRRRKVGIMRLFLHWDQRGFAGGFARAAAAGLCLVVLTLAGCGGSGTASPTPIATPTANPNTLPSYNDLPKSYTDPTNLPTALRSCITPASAPADLHLWAPDEVIVGLASTSQDFSDATTPISEAIKQMLPPNIVKQGFTLDPKPVRIWGDGLGAFVFHVSPMCLQQVVDTLNYRVMHNNGIAFTAPSQNRYIPIEITGVSPEWFIGGAGDGIAGSPGGPPQANAAQGNSPSSSTASPTVYVLDSADKLGSGSGYATNVTDSPDPGQYTSLCPTTAAGSPITTGTCYIEMQSLSKRLTESDTALSGETAYMSEYGTSTDTTIREHGVFVSDLIHHLAPDATIRLLRTLNDYGAGKVIDLMSSLSSVLRSGSPPGTIVNMSLTTVLSPGCLLDIWENWDSYASHAQPGMLACANPVLQLQPEKPYLVLMFTQLNQLIQDLEDRGYLLVAAAGTHLSGARDQYAGMPAAFCHVMAVTAVTDASSKAGTSWQFNQSSATTDSFKSSQSATPPSTTWISNVPYLAGGTCMHVPAVSNVIRSLQQGSAGPPPMPTLQPTNPGNAVYAVGTNVCSLYLQNTSSTPAAPPAGYALWDGTSFATAIMSGNLAANSGSIPGTLDETQPCK